MKQHWMMGPLCGLFSALLALPAWVLGTMLLTAPYAAQAQTLERLPTWAVVSFSNSSGYGGHEVGVQASDGFVVELSKTNKYDIVPRTQTEQAITNNGLVRPLGTIALQQLAQDVDSDAVVTGDVAAVTFTNNPRRATVSVVIKVVDRISGDLINGAVAQGISTPRAIDPNADDDDALVDQAIENADFEAVKQISAFNLPRATVLINDGTSEVTLNEGTQEGLYTGLNMIVTRDGNEVGKIQVSEVDPDESYARIIDQGSGIGPQDVATAVYQLPPYSIGPGGNFHVQQSYSHDTSLPIGVPQGPASHFFTGAGGIITSILAAAGLYALATNGHDSNSIGGGSTGGVTAVMDNNVDPTVTDLLLPDTNADLEPTDDATSGGFVPLRVKITFSPGQLGGNPGTIQYHIFRNPEPAILQNPLAFLPTAEANNVILGGITSLPLFSPASTTEYDSADDEGPLSYTVPEAGVNTTFITFNYYDTAGTTTTPELPIAFTGLNVGDRVNYTVEALYEVPDLSTGTGLNGEPVGIGTGVPTTSTTSGTGTTASTGTTNASTTTVTSFGPYIYTLSEPQSSNYVTYLQPVILRETDAAAYPHTSGTPPISTNTPLDDAYAFSTGPSNVNVTVYSVFGGTASALQYCLQFSPDPNFGSDVSQYTEIVPNTASSANFREGNAFSFGSINLSTVYSNPGTLYVRVGVADLRNGTPGSDTNPYVWSNVDPANDSGNSLPPSLTPGNSAVTTSARKAGSGQILTPYGVDHVRSFPTTAEQPAAVPLSAGKNHFTPSETIGGASESTSHPLAPHPVVVRP